ncbi:MAG: zinc ABC transporter substrate-binding protein [Rhodothermales bacterium]|nr:zinc ABC transporter substrate-binding protein [Rhodothermales bacterium]MBO6781389.1 zinc ABC transporter substrate-binding protein [Rhodothermales bacterium]
MKAVLLVLAVGLTACTSPPSRTGAPVATMHPVSLLLGDLTGAPVASILPAGVSPHAYDPLPSAARLAAQSSLVVGVTPEVDGWIEDLSPGPVAWLLTPEMDPHAWLDPLAVAGRLPALAETMCGQTPLGCDQLRERARMQSEALAQTAADMQRLRGQTVVVASTFLSAYLARAGVVTRFVIAPVEGVEPSPAAVRAAIDHARETGIVVGQTGFPELAARRVAEAAGVPFVAVDPVGRPETAPTYDALIRAITSGIAQAVRTENATP